MTKPTLFITGTDTEIGKTLTSLALIHWYQAQGHAVTAYKPIAAGCNDSPQGRRNDDALALMQAADSGLSYAQINPIALAEPVSPHIAATNEGRPIDIPALVQHIQQTRHPQRHTLIEGVGGWHAPLTEQHSVQDLAQALNCPTILVVGLRLGCLNHALLSAQAILASGVPLLGWIANHLDPKMDAQQANIDTLKQRLPAPLLGQVPHQAQAAPSFQANPKYQHRLIA